MKKRIVFIILFIFGLDILSKYLVFNHVEYGTSKVLIPNFFALVPVKNTGAAFSFFSNNNLILILISILILLYILYTLKNLKLTKTTTISYGLIIGGIFGNLYDRIFLRHVRDFISLKFYKWDFAIFNIADIAIVVGAVLLFILMIRGKMKYDD